MPASSRWLWGAGEYPAIATVMLAPRFVLSYLLFVILVCKHVGEMVQAKGRNPLPYQVLMAIGWTAPTRDEVRRGTALISKRLARSGITSSPSSSSASKG